MKIKISGYIISLIIFLIVTFIILFSSVLRHHYIGGEKFPEIRKIAVYIAEIPSNIKIVLGGKGEKEIKLHPIYEESFFNKDFFEQKKLSENDSLILVSRSDGDLKRAVVEIRRISNFELLHTFAPSIKEIHESTNYSKEMSPLKFELNKERYYFWSPVITNNGDLIFHSQSPLVKIDFCSNVKWVNDKYIFHHAINLDKHENIYVPIKIYPHTLDKILVGENFDSYEDDGIAILDQNGNISFQKSVSKILIENNLKHRLFAQHKYRYDPIHLNDIQPINKNSEFWEEGDVFISLRNQSSVILYRPKSNKIIKIIEGKFALQHDVDVLSDSEISIFNNNSYFNYKNEKIVENNQLLKFDFRNNNFNSIIENSFKKYQIKTPVQGSSHILEDGSILIEDNENLSIFYFNKQGELIWRFNNLSNDKKLYKLSWFSVIEEDEKKNKILNLIKENKC